MGAAQCLVTMTQQFQTTLSQHCHELLTLFKKAEIALSCIRQTKCKVTILKQLSLAPDDKQELVRNKNVQSSYC